MYYIPASIFENSPVAGRLKL